MALPTRQTFRGRINDKSVWDTIKKLDYTLNTYEERKALVDQMLAEDEFLVEYFDNYFKVEVSQDDYLSEDNNIVRAMEKVTDYLLFSPDLKDKELTEKEKNDEHRPKKIKYVFYAKDKLNEKMNKEKSVEELVEQYSNMGYDEIIAFLIDQGANFRKENKQRILESDYKDKELMSYFWDCRNTIFFYRGLLNDKKNKLTFRQRKLIMKMLGEIKTDMILYKEKIKGTIYFKALMNGNEEPEYDLFNFTDEEHVAALLKCTKSDLKSDLGILNFDLNRLLDQIPLSPTELEILRMWRSVDSTQETIADELGVKREFVTATIKKIVSKIIKQYKENYEDWLYLNYKKGDYKTCSKCGEIKLIQRFNKDSSRKDGFMYICKKCESVGKN